MSGLTPLARALPSISPRKVVLTGIVPSTPEYFARRAGDSPFAEGERIPPGTHLRRPAPAYFYPHIPPELPIPFDYSVVHEDSDLIVVDKPHFLPTTTNGRIVRETLQTRLREDFGEDDIVPIHRLDRLTAGIVLCSRRAETRGAYQRMFQDKAVVKEYLAGLARPLDYEGTVELGMRKVKGERQVRVDPAGVATVTRVSAHGVRARLWPETGHTHQLRVLLNHLGSPIAGDDTYPVDRGLDLYDFSQPLSLVHVCCEFNDPLTGKRRRFRSSLDETSSI